MVPGLHRRVPRAAIQMFKPIAISWQADESHDRAQFSMLLQEYRSAIVQFLYRMVQEGSAAEELALEAFSQLYRSSSSGPDSVASAMTRLFRIATDLALLELRNRTRPLPEESVDTLENARCTINEMPVKQRAAVLMHKYHRMESGQIAKVLNCSESGARALLFSAYETLRRRLARCEVSWPALQE